MSRIRFIGALSISVALIGGAIWFRFVRIPLYTAEVISIQGVGQFPYENTSLEDFLNASSSPATTSAATALSQTDLIGRRLFTDYVALKSQGEVTPDELNALAESYAESIRDFDISIPKVDSNRIIVLPDSEDNLAKYGNAITNIRNKYKNLVAAQAENSGGNIADTGSPAFSTFMGAAGKLFQTSANELLLVGVPTSLAPNHLNLINNYLESAVVMESISNTAKDPVRAYAALNIYVQHAGQELELFLNIQKIMMANGIIFNGGI